MWRLSTRTLPSPPSLVLSRRTLFASRRPCRLLSQARVATLSRRTLFIPPPWIRPLLRPLLILASTFVAGVIVQMFQGKGKSPPKWLLTASAEGESEVALSAFAPRAAGLGVVALALWVTRLRNPLWQAYLGPMEVNLQLADSQASLPLNALWDTRSANDTMKARLAAMERHLGAALAIGSGEGSDVNVRGRVGKLREKGYSNGARIALKRAAHWGVTGEVTSFEKALALVDEYRARGGIVNDDEVRRVTEQGFAVRCGSLLTLAQSKANQGDVAGCLGAIGEIRRIRERCEDANIGVKDSDLEETLQDAHKFHLNHMLEEARLKHNKSRLQARNAVNRARIYAESNGVPFDESAAKGILVS